MSAYAHPVASVYANVYADVTTPVYRKRLHMHDAQNTCLNACILSAKNAHAPVRVHLCTEQKLLYHEDYCELIMSLVRA